MIGRAPPEALPVAIGPALAAAALVRKRTVARRSAFVVMA